MHTHTINLLKPVGTILKEYFLSDAWEAQDLNLLISLRKAVDRKFNQSGTTKKCFPVTNSHELENIVWLQGI